MEEEKLTSTATPGKAKPAMGASNSRPVTAKFTDGEENDIIKYAAPSIQGWRAKMEDELI